MGVETGLLIAGVVVVGALAQTVCGFGLAVVVVPPLALVIEPADAVAVSLVLLVVSSGLVVAGERSSVDSAAVAWLLAGAVVGLPLGLAAIRAASADALRAAVAVAVVAAVAVLVTGRPRLGRGRSTLLVGGLLTGALTTSLTTNGPPTVLAVQGRELEPSAFRPTVSAVLGLASSAGLGLFAADGRLDGEVPAALAYATPALLVGWGLGVVLRPRIRVEWFRRAVIGLLLVGAAVSLGAALR